MDTAEIGLPTANRPAIDIFFQGGIELFYVDAFPTISTAFEQMWPKDQVVSGINFLPNKITAYQQEVASSSLIMDLFWVVLAGSIAIAAAAIFGFTGAPLAFFFFAGAILAATKVFSYTSEIKFIKEASTDFANTLNYIKMYSPEIEEKLLSPHDSDVHQEPLESSNQTIQTAFDLSSETPDEDIEEDSDIVLLLSDAKNQDFFGEFRAIQKFYSGHLKNHPQTLSDNAYTYINQNKLGQSSFVSSIFDEIHLNWKRQRGAMIELKGIEDHQIFHYCDAVTPAIILITGVALGILAGPAAWGFGISAGLYLIYGLAKTYIINTTLENANRDLQDCKRQIQNFFQEDWQGIEAKLDHELQEVENKLENEEEVDLNQIAKETLLNIKEEINQLRLFYESLPDEPSENPTDPNDSIIKLV